VITVLTDSAATDAVCGALLAGEVAGKPFIDMSAVPPESEKALAAKVRARGAAFVECPVGGSVGPARASEARCEVLPPSSVNG
jgi:3-hydroxyisobutyrate dehydrogenase